MEKLINLIEYSKSLNILVIEDNHSTCLLVRKVLRKEKFDNFQVMYDLKSAWEYLNLKENSLKIDVILMDLRFLKEQGVDEIDWMGLDEETKEKEGFLFARKLKEAEPELFKKLNIIYYSSDIDEVKLDQQKAFCCGHYYFSKEKGLSPIVDLLNYLEVQKQRSLLVEHQDLFDQIMSIACIACSKYEDTFSCFDSKGRKVKLKKNYPISILKKVHKSKLIQFDSEHFLNPNLVEVDSDINADINKLSLEKIYF